MFSELPKLLDKNFALGYFLPGTIYLISTVYLLDKFNLLPNLINQLQQDLLIGTTTIGLISWLIGVFLLGANRSIFRLLEGYGEYNPARLLLGFEKWKFNRINEELSLLDNEYIKFQENGKAFPPELRVKRNRLMQKLVERYPDAPEWILPTSFGNTIRAFEVYPRVVYGIEAIQGWNRLLGVIPKDFRELIDNAKSQVDFWVNLGFLSFIFLVQYLGLCIFSGSLESIGLSILALILAILASTRAESSAVQWGELVKSSFDVFLPKLKKELELNTLPENERKMWTQFSQVIIYRLPSANQKNNSSKESKNKAASPKNKV
ncbi:MAG: hypothetical protein Q8L64_00225 [bacterium]|nr:hypothetical protein [bacterium]